MNNHEVESILCQVKCDCCGNVTTYDEEDIDNKANSFVVTENNEDELY